MSLWQRAQVQTLLRQETLSSTRDFQLIEEGDRVAVAVSGGKDSLSLLRLLQVRRRSAPEQYDLVALHVLDGALHDEGNSLEPLETWLQQNRPVSSITSWTLLRAVEQDLPPRLESTSSEPSSAAAALK